MKKFETPVLNIDKFNIKNIVMLSAVTAAVESLEGDANVTSIYKINMTKSTTLD